MRHATRLKHLKHLHKTTHYRRNCFYHSCHPSEHSDINLVASYERQLTTDKTTSGKRNNPTI